MTEFPYDTYVDKVVGGLDYEEIIETWLQGEVIGQYKTFNLDERGLRALLTDAWLSGLGHSLELIETKRRSNDVEPAEASVGRPAL